MAKIKITESLLRKIIREELTTIITEQKNPLDTTNWTFYDAVSQETKEPISLSAVLGFIQKKLRAGSEINNLYVYHPNLEQVGLKNDWINLGKLPEIKNNSIFTLKKWVSQQTQKQGQAQQGQAQQGQVQQTASGGVGAELIELLKSAPFGATVRQPEEFGKAFDEIIQGKNYTFQGKFGNINFTPDNFVEQFVTIIDTIAAKFGEEILKIKVEDWNQLKNTYQQFYDFNTKIYNLFQKYPKQLKSTNIIAPMGPEEEKYGSYTSGNASIAATRDKSRVINNFPIKGKKSFILKIAGYGVIRGRNVIKQMSATIVDIK